MPNGKVEEASDIDKFQHNVRHPAKDIYIVPGIKRDSLLSIPKFVNTNYIASSTRTKSTSTMPAKQQSLFLMAQSSKDSDASKQTYGKSPSSKTYRTTTLPQSSAIDF
jgi:hypothetical protein